MKIEGPEQLDRIDFDKGDGLVPLIAQHVDTGEVRMLGYADRAALEASLATGELHFHSCRSGALWRKGATSGNVLALVSLHADCDADALLALVLPAGPTCHIGADSCFEAAPFLQRLAGIIEARAAARAAGEAAGSYTARLLDDRNLRLKKLTEEAGELAVACADGNAAGVAAEAADLLYHALVACCAAGVPFEDVVKILRQRHLGKL
jgi:phosphoribosyl-ATP pyrophosphohydrolase/phosphoribosyl-AMP cyclohydrolase